MLPSDLPFRIGTTSYIIPDDILPNARFLAGKVQDIQLVLFELDGDQSNLPDARQIEELNTLASQHGLTYTVHLPLDLRLASEPYEVHISLRKAQRVIDATLGLNPQAYIVHLDGKEERVSTDRDILTRWQQQAVSSLQHVARLTGNIKQLAVENLETYPVDFNDNVIRQAGCSRCIDIGHLWLDGHDPIEFFNGRFEQTSVMHLHGIKERDHKSLQHMPAQMMDDLFRYLLEHNFTGVLTLEIFAEDDLNTSMQAISECLKRIRGRG
jgi:sugar phosphate isomerase/epimerase